MDHPEHEQLAAFFNRFPKRDRDAAGEVLRALDTLSRNADSAAQRLALRGILKDIRQLIADASGRKEALDRADALDALYSLLTAVDVPDSPNPNTTVFAHLTWVMDEMDGDGSFAEPEFP